MCHGAEVAIYMWEGKHLLLGAKLSLRAEAGGATNNRAVSVPVTSWRRAGAP
jgi:hypothetical protein